jgi:hypothetical protein
LTLIPLALQTLALQIPALEADDRRYQLETQQTILMPDPTLCAPDDRTSGGPPRGRRLLLRLIVVLALLAVAWAGLWYVLADRTQAAIDDAIAREAKAGHDLTCASRQLSGFPFKILVRCDQAKLELAAPDGKAVIALPSLTGHAEISDPLHLVVEAQGPLSIEAPGRPSAEVTWKSLKASLALGIGSFPQRDLVIAAPVLRMRDGQNMIASNADRLEFHAHRDPIRPAEDDAVEVTARLARLVSPFANALTGEDAPADAEIALSISQASALLPHEQEQPQPALERWRQAGGSLHLAKLTAAKATLKAGFSGDLRLDDQHRAAGEIETSLEGAQALLPRLGLPPAAASFLKLNGGSLRLPVALANGRVGVGPFAVARLPSLY